jgi:hypothetical protein
MSEMRASLKLLTHEPEKRKIDGWRELEYDATFELDGLMWRRVSGFGQVGSREDWVLDLPAVKASVTRWHDQQVWQRWPSDKPRTMIEAMRAQVVMASGSLRAEISRHNLELAKMRASLKLLDESLKT